jgi:serine/threonine-protein kinase HipA
MAIAKAVGFAVPPFALVKIEGLGNVFAIRRFDVTPDEEPLMMEDMGQLIRVPSADKYESTYERVVAAITAHSSAARIDIADFYRRLIFCYFIANADMHLKNWTLVENERAAGSFKLSPCYDLLNTRLPIPREKSDLGLKMQGKDRNLRASYFRRFGHEIGLAEPIVKSVFAELPTWLDVATDLVQKSLLKPTSKDRYLELLHERCTVLMKD